MKARDHYLSRFLSLRACVTANTRAPNGIRYALSLRLQRTCSSCTSTSQQASFAQFFYRHLRRCQVVGYRINIEPLLCSEIKPSTQQKSREKIKKKYLHQELLRTLSWVSLMLIFLSFLWMNSTINQAENAQQELLMLGEKLTGKGCQQETKDRQIINH